MDLLRLIFFVENNTLLTDAYEMKSDTKFYRILYDDIFHRGTMDKLISDCVKVEKSNKSKDMLRDLLTDDWQSESISDSKTLRSEYVKLSSTLLDRTGSPSFYWLLALTNAYFLLNHNCNQIINITPLQASTRSTCDASPFSHCLLGTYLHCS